MQRYCKGYCLCILIAATMSACTKQKEVNAPSSVVSEPIMPVGNAEKGKELYTTCLPCHGAAGEGNKQLNGPALANTDGWYQYRQLMNFRNDIRGFSQHDTLGFQMAAMAKLYKDSIAIRHVVAYIKTMPEVTLSTSIKGDIVKGKRTYETICGSCHGQNAKGNEMMNAPRLSGLNDWYIKRQMSNFKNSVRGAHAKDTFGAQMIPMMALLPNDEAVNNVIAYITSNTQPVSQ